MKSFLGLWCVSLLLFICGCAVAHRSVDYYSACRNDSACYARMQEASNSTKNMVSGTISSMPGANGLAELAGAVAGMLVSLFTGIQYGKCLCKKEG